MYSAADIDNVHLAGDVAELDGPADAATVGVDDPALDNKGTATSPTITTPCNLDGEDPTKADPQHTIKGTSAVF